PLDSLIDSRRFRPDLFYRLNVIPFQVPPLRERREDVAVLIDHFNKRFSTEYGRQPKLFADDALTRLQNYSWPGNVRELKNLVERVVIMSGKDVITAAHLPELNGIAEVVAGGFRFPS